MTIHHTATLRAFLALALTASLAPACDDSRQSADSDFRYVPLLGGYWGDGDKGCDGIYMKSEYGAICLPAMPNTHCKDLQVNECGQPTGKVPNIHDTGLCVFNCEGDYNCLAGQKCDPDLGFCVWQNIPEEKPHTFAPCEDATDCPAGEFCVFKTDEDGIVTGSFCAVPCGECNDPDVLYCEERLSTATPACDSAGACIAPCQDNSQCLGGSVCLSGACAWPLP